jgi:hypothetical protein
MTCTFVGKRNKKRCVEDRDNRLPLDTWWFASA